jgi:uncharacterized membrane protein YhdT
MLLLVIYTVGFCTNAYRFLVKAFTAFYSYPLYFESAQFSDFYAFGSGIY